MIEAIDKLKITDDMAKKFLGDIDVDANNLKDILKRDKFKDVFNLID